MLNAIAPRNVACLWLIAAALLPSEGARAQTNGERMLQSAHVLLERGLDEQAVAEYEGAIERLEDAPLAADARYGQAIAYQRLGDIDSAVDALLAIPPDLAFGYRTDADVLLMTMLAQSGENEQAVLAAERLLHRSDHASWATSVSLHVELLYRLGRYRESVSSFRDHRTDLEKRSRDAFARAALFAGLAGMDTAESSDDHAIAAEILELSVADDSPEDIRNHGLLAAANAWQRAKRSDDAERVYRAAISVGDEKTESLARLGLGALLRTDGRAEEAMEILGIADRSQFDRTSRARFDLELGLSQLESGDARRASRSLDRVLESEETQFKPAASYWRAKADLRRELFDDAAARFDDANTRYPNSPLAPETAFDLGVAHQRAGNPDQARHVFSEFRSRWPEHSLAEAAHVAEAMIVSEHGSAVDAISLYQDFLRGYKQSDRVPSVSLLLSEAFYGSGRFAEASDCAEPFIGSTDAEIAMRAAMLHGLALHADGRSHEAFPVLIHVCDALGDTAAAAPVHLALAQIHAAQEAWQSTRDASAMFLLAASRDDTRRSEAQLLNGIAHARLDAKEEAIASFERVLRTTGEQAEGVLAQTRLELGQLYHADGSSHRATTILRELIDEHSDSRFAPYALRLLAAMAAEAGDTDKADSLYTRAAASGDGDFATVCRLDRARMLLAAGRDEYAATVLRDASDDPSVAWRIIALGRAGQHTEVIRLADSVDTEHLPGDLCDTFVYQVADSERHTGNLAGAGELFSSLLDSPNLAGEAALQAAELAMERDDFSAATDLLERTLEQAPFSNPDLCASIRYQLAWCHYELEDFRAVVDVLEASPCGSESLTAPTALLLGEALARLERHADAARQFAEALEHDLPQDQLASALLRLGETSAAIQDWRASARAFARHREEYADSPRWFVAEFGIGWALENQGQHGDALDHYRSVIDDHRGETAARAQFQVGECLFALGRLDEAVRELLRVDTMYSEPQWSAAAQFEAGRCFEAMNKIGEARALYRLVIEQHAGSDWAEASAERLRAIAAPGGS